MARTSAKLESASKISRFAGIAHMKGPRQVVETGDVVSVRVVEVDAKRKRIGLAMSSEQRYRASDQKRCRKSREGKIACRRKKHSAVPAANNVFAEALAGMKKK